MESPIQLEIALKEHRLGPITRIPPGEGRDFDVDGVEIAVFHGRDGAIYATQALCPHREGPLADGLMGGGVLVCPFHGWKFDLHTGQALLGACGLTTYPASLTADGEIVVQTPGATSEAIP